jgi:hypothetical protein
MDQASVDAVWENPHLSPRELLAYGLTFLQSNLDTVSHTIRR